MGGAKAFSVNMDFDLIEFSLNPTIDVYNRCRKKDLILIADFFNISVLKESTKQVIKEQLYDELVSAGILPGQSEAGEEELSEAGVETSEVFLNVDASDETKLAVKLKELDLLIKKQECEAQLIKLRVVQAETERAVKLRQLDLQASGRMSRPIPVPRTKIPSDATMPVNQPIPAERSDFDVSRYVKLVPPFREAEVDAYFIAFERVAGKLRWPKDMWALLLQCNFTGKAQEVCAALPVDQSLDYEIVKAAVLRAYELVPEAYRQKFRSQSKSFKQTCVEFAREKRVLFEKWCLASRVVDFEQLQELLLLEEFKNCMPEAVVIYLNKKLILFLMLLC